MKKHTASWNYFEYEGLDLELFICAEVFKLRSLHYGYWNSHARPTLSNLRKAQQRYTDTLVKLIPANVVNVLDVGCGIGDVAHALLCRGYVVTAISPDRHHERYLERHTKNLSFILTTFEEFTSSEQYDLILMSESQNYFATDLGFKQCQRYLKTKGYLLVSGIFRKQEGEAFRDVINVQQEYLAKAKHYGFRLVKYIDITKKVLPTLVLAHGAIDQYLKPLLHVIDHYLLSSSSVKSAIIRMVIGKQINNGLDVFRHYQERTDPSQFEDTCTYLRLLFQLE